jgi:NADP-dependent 3-hydroxy acid dehydrogenase YdfG
MGKLDDKTILVTGASSGFGKAIAIASAREGAKVALVARRQDALEQVAQTIKENGGEALVCPLDVTNDDQIHEAIANVIDTFGSIDVLVNNAGTNVTERTIADTSSEQWRLLLDVNLTSAFVFTKAVMPAMKERGDGLIVNLSSQAGLFPNTGGGVAYSSSKMGMEALNTITNEEGNPFGIRACLLCPGAGNTPIIDRRPRAYGHEERMKMIQPEDIADTVVFVAGLPPRININLISMMPTQN